MRHILAIALIDWIARPHFIPIKSYNNRCCKINQLINNKPLTNGPGMVSLFTMKFSAHLLTSLFVLVLGILHIQPLFLHPESKGETTCCQSRCKKENPCREKNDQSDQDGGCPNQGCNPFIPCAMGSCCYVTESFYSNPGISILQKQKHRLFNDNRLLNTSLECWHPPEWLSWSPRKHIW